MKGTILQRIAFFTAGATPTVAEKQEIEAIVEAIKPKFEIVILNAAISTDSGAGVIECDFANGSVPGAVDAPEFDPETLSAVDEV